MLKETKCSVNEQTQQKLQPASSMTSTTDCIRSELENYMRLWHPKNEKSEDNTNSQE